jgi:hypothetical protein
MKSTAKVLILALCFGVMSAWAQDDRSFITHESGDWSQGTTWEEFIPNIGWIYPATQIPNSSVGAIRIGAAHTVTIRNFDVTVDQLTVDGRLNVNPGRTLTIADGPGADLVTNLNNATVWIDGTLINNGQIQINLGALKIGTLVNNGDIEIGGVFQFDQGTITGNDLRYGLTGSAVVNLAPGYTIDDDNHIWPSVNGPANLTVVGVATLNGARTVSGSLKISGTLNVIGALATNGTTEVTGTLRVVGTHTNNGTAQVFGTLQLAGPFINNGTTQISGTVEIEQGGAAGGNAFVYMGCCNKLVFTGSNSVDSGNVFWPSANGPLNIIIAEAASVVLNTARTTSFALDISGTLQVADTLTTFGTTRVLSDGLLHVDGVLINNGTAQVSGTLHVAGELTNNATIVVYERLEVAGTLLNIATIQVYRTLQVTGELTNDGTIQIFAECQLAGILTNNGAMQIDGTFQIDQGGVADGSDFEYGVLFGAQGGTLVFNNATGSYEINSGAVYWPATDGPANVIVQGAGGITMNVARTVIGLFEAAASVTNVHNLTLSGTVKIVGGGSLGSSPVYSDHAILVYDVAGAVDVGAEWGSGTSVGSGVPMNVEINEGTTVNMPGSSRTCPGNLTIRGTLVLSTTSGADLSVGGDWYSDRYIRGMLVSNSRAVIFNGENGQTISGVTTFDDLIVNNQAGISVPGYDDTEVQAIDSVTVNQTLTFVAGNIRLGEVWQSLLILSGAVTGDSTWRHVVTYGESRVERSIAGGGSFQFPVGPTETSYNPLTIALDPDDPTETFSVRVDSTIEPGALSDSVCVQRTWDIQEATEGDNHAALTFQWTGAEEGTSFFRNSSSTYLYNGDYIEVVNNGTASGTDPYIVTTTEEFPITEFARFVVGTHGALTAIDGFENAIPVSFALSQNYPNPFNPSTTIRYAIPQAGFVSLKVYNLLGKEIETLANQKQQAGEHEIRWNPEGLPSGVYFYQMQAGNFKSTKKLILLH